MILRWSIAERFGWSLDQVDGLSLADVHDFIVLEDAREQKEKSDKKR